MESEKMHSQNYLWSFMNVLDVIFYVSIYSRDL